MYVKSRTKVFSHAGRVADCAHTVLCFPGRLCSEEHLCPVRERRGHESMADRLGPGVESMADRLGPGDESMADRLGPGDESSVF